MTTPPDGMYVGLMPGMTPESSIGMDVQRVWANGVQVTPTPDVTFIVFREQIGALEENKEQRVMLKNVASIVMPTAVALQLAKVLESQIAAITEVTPDRGDAPTT